MSRKISAIPTVQLNILYPTPNSLCSSSSILKICYNKLLSLFGPVILLLALGNKRSALAETCLLQRCHFSLPNILRKASVSERVSHNIFGVFSVVCFYFKSWERIYPVLSCSENGTLNTAVQLAKRALFCTTHFFI